MTGIVIMVARPIGGDGRQAFGGDVSETRSRVGI
jgi:hypothetical protein